MNRGSRASRQVSERMYGQRFNEAPIHESGKSRRAEREPLCNSDFRFNEAPIHESGKSTRRGD